MAAGRLPRGEGPISQISNTRTASNSLNGNGRLNGNGAEQRARQMRIAGGLFIAGALFGLPSTLILTDVGPEQMLPLTAVGVLSGIVCLALPWERFSPGWIHVALLAAIVEVSVLSQAVNSSFLLYFVVIGVFVSYVFGSRRAVGAHLGLISLVLAGQAVAFAGEEEAAVQLALLTFSTMLVSAIMVAYLRESLETNRLKYRGFAEEALELVAKLRGEIAEKEWIERQGIELRDAGQLALPDKDRAPVEPGAARRRLPSRRLGLVLGGGLLAIPLGLASLATAGVHLPTPATAAFAEVGISLPNQEGAAESNAFDPVAGAAEGSKRAAVSDDDDRARGTRDRNSGGSRGASGGGAGSDTAAGGASTSEAGQAVAAPSFAAPAPPPQPAGEPPAGGQGAGPGSGGPVDRALRDTIDLLNRTLP